MQYSIVNGQRTEAKPNLLGLCICCNKPTYSACGKFISWHWRHKNLKDCDNWWEAETEWHREWKLKFPEHWREVIQYDNFHQEKHIADVKTDKGVVLEFQNSPITIDELKSRENFYDKMIWIVNGLGFKDNFEFGYKLPNFNSEFPKNYKFTNSKFMSVYEYLENSNPNDFVEILNTINNIPLKEFVEKYHTKHYTFNWKQARQVWFQTQKPVFIDFNDGLLWRILFKTNISDSPICCYYSKDEFVKHYLQ
jgi:competence protein CoiA